MLKCFGCLYIGFCSYWNPAISIAFVSFGIPKQHGRDHVLGQELLSRSEIGGGAGREYR